MVKSELDYNRQFGIAKKALPILNFLFPQSIVESVIMDFLLGDRHHEQRINKPLSFTGEDDKLISQIQAAKEGLTTLNLPGTIPKYLEKNVVNLVKRHHLTLQCIHLPTVNLTDFFWLSILSFAHFFLTELEISADKSLTRQQLEKLLIYLETNATLLKIRFPFKPMPSLEEKAIHTRIEDELNYNQQLRVADITMPILAEIYEGLDGQKMVHMVDIIISYFIGDETHPQRLVKSVGLNTSGVTIFGKNFQQLEFSDIPMRPDRYISNY